MMYSLSLHRGFKYSAITWEALYESAKLCDNEVEFQGK